VLLEFIGFIELLELLTLNQIMECGFFRSRQRRVRTKHQGNGFS